MLTMEMFVGKKSGLWLVSAAEMKKLKEVMGGKWVESLCEGTTEKTKRIGV